MNHPSSTLVEPINGRYLAADNARFWCMFAVVALHCTRIFTLGAQENSLAAYLVATPVKFGTIGFFLVSGFLLGPDLARCDARNFLSKKLRKVFLPWLFWSALYVLAMTLSDSMQQRGAFLAGVPWPTAVAGEIMRCLTATALWFVPNLLLALSILLAFRKHVQSLWLGAALLAANLFYTANIYAQWMPAQHTRALFAFAFYLWLGHFAATHLAFLNSILSATPTPLLIAVTGAAAMAAFAEACWLQHVGSMDPLNTLRPSNQLFSILTVLCFCKLRRQMWPDFVDVGRHTFGIYLSHAIIVGIVISSMRHLLEVTLDAHSLAIRAVLWLVATAVVWTAGFLLSRHIAETPGLCWMQGLSRPSARLSADYEALPDGVAHFIG
jgi:surface polysaccharide O-acyltransferase-like enzyme